MALWEVPSQCGGNGTENQTEREDNEENRAPRVLTNRTVEAGGESLVYAFTARKKVQLRHVVRHVHVCES